MQSLTLTFKLHNLLLQWIINQYIFYIYSQVNTEVEQPGVLPVNHALDKLQHKETATNTHENNQINLFFKNTVCVCFI